MKADKESPAEDAKGDEPDPKAKSKRKPKLGTGARFAALKSELARTGAKDPGALAAFIGRKKYGAKKMAALSAKGRKHS